MFQISLDLFLQETPGLVINRIYIHLLGGHKKGQNIGLPSAGVYPVILWLRPIYTPVYILAQANSYPLRPQYTTGYKLAQAINIPGYNLAWAALTPDIIRAASNLSRLNAD